MQISFTKIRFPRALFARTNDPAPHFPAVALQGCLNQSTPRHLLHEVDHCGPDTLMLSPAGIAKANNFYLIALLEHGVVPAMAHHIGSHRPEHHRCGLRTAGNKKHEGEKALHSALMPCLG